MREAWTNLVEYMGATERNHWIENGRPNDHIYNDFRTINRFLNENNNPGNFLDEDDSDDDDDDDDEDDKRIEESELDRKTQKLIDLIVKN